MLPGCGPHWRIRYASALCDTTGRDSVATKHQDFGSLGRGTAVALTNSGIVWD